MEAVFFFFSFFLTLSIKGWCFGKFDFLVGVFLPLKKKGESKVRVSFSPRRGVGLPAWCRPLLESPRHRRVCAGRESRLSRVGRYVGPAR